MTQNGAQTAEVTEALLNHQNLLNQKIDIKDDQRFERGPSSKLPFPKAAMCVIGTRLFEKFSFHAIRAVLVIYLTTQLEYTPQDSTMIFHIFNMLVFMTSIIGAIISDSWLGKYRTVFYFSIAYVLGVALLNLGSFSILRLPSREITIVSLILLACANGCLKPCILALGGDQFKRPEQDEQLSLYYSLVVLAMKISYVVATAMTPTLRNELKCFGNDHCFPAAFGVPGIMAVLAFFGFLLGTRWFVHHKPTGNIFFKVIACIWTAIRYKWKNNKTDPTTHWLDSSESIYGRQLIHEVKIFLNVIAIFIPIPMFYALSEQTGSRWTFQASTMNGDIGFYTIKPDQMQIVRPVMVIVLIILFESCFNKQLERIGIKGSLGKMVFGCLMSAVAFVISGTLELQTASTLATLPMPGYTQVSLFNSLPCDFNMQSKIPELNGVYISSMDTYKTNVRLVNGTTQPLDVLLETDNPKCIKSQILAGHLISQKAFGYFIRKNKTFEFEQNPQKEINGLVTLRVLTNASTDYNISFIDLHHKNQTTFTMNNLFSSLYLRASTYAVNLNQKTISVIELRHASVNTIIFSEIDGLIVTKMFQVTQPNTVHMLWMIPQYAFMAIGEALVSVTGLNFAYKESPNSMKSILQALYMLTVAGGNLIDIIILGANMFESEMYLSFFFAGLMFIDVLLFVWLVQRYKRIDYVHDLDRAD